jgi:hypothetical protein
MSAVGTALRLVIGWISAVVGVVNLIADADDLSDLAYLAFNGMLVIGGGLLVGLGSIRARPGIAGCLAGAVIMVAGPVTRYPFPLAGRRLAADVLFWAYAGLIVVLLVTVGRRTTARTGEHPPVG